MYWSSSGDTRFRMGGFYRTGSYNPAVVSAASRIDQILADFPREEWDRLVQTRRDFHRHPELAFEEHRTAETVASRMRDLGLTPRTGIGRTGVIADAGAGGPRLMLRADMDALPLQEATGAPYASQTPGRMHACGHDGHLAIAMAVAARLVRTPPPRALRFLYQPAEEGRGGAQECTDDGALDGVDAALGLHLWNPLPVGMIGVNRGALMAAVDNFTIDIEGRGGHGAAPHEAADPILAAARVIESLQSIVSREISPLDSAVVTIGSIHGGTAFNIIPNSVQMIGTARSFTEATGRALPEKIGRIVTATAAACGVTARIRYERINGATVNDAKMADLLIDVASRLLGDENVETDTRTLGGEDMSVYLDRVPGCFFFVGCAREGAMRPHHSPEFDIDERALAVGTVVMEAVAANAHQRDTQRASVAQRAGESPPPTMGSDFLAAAIQPLASRPDHRRQAPRRGALVARAKHGGHSLPTKEGGGSRCGSPQRSRTSATREGRRYRNRVPVSGPRQ